MASTKPLALFLLACLAPAAWAATVSKCIWRNDVVCDASPSFVISRLPTLASSPADNPLAVQVLQGSAMEAACHIFETSADCVAADACTWDNTLTPSCNVDASLLAQRDVFKSGCPGSLMESYVRCGSAFNEKECGRMGPSCVWYDELQVAAAQGGSHGQLRHLSEVKGAGGSAPALAPRACMPKQMFALEKKKDKEGTAKIMKQIASQDPAVWGDCPGVVALRAMAKSCTAFSSPGTCKASAPLCRWNDLVRACVATGAGQTAWVLGANSTEVADGAKACARASSKVSCASLDTVSVDPKVFASVQTGDFSTTNAAGARRGAAAAAVVAAAAAVGAAVLL